MGTLRRLAAALLLAVGTVAALLGAFQVVRVLWAMAHPPEGVFEPLVPLVVGGLALLVGLWLLKVGRALRPADGTGSD